MLYTSNEIKGSVNKQLVVNRDCTQLWSVYTFNVAAVLLNKLSCTYWTVPQWKSNKVSLKFSPWVLPVLLTSLVVVWNAALYLIIINKKAMSSEGWDCYHFSASMCTIKAASCKIFINRCHCQCSLLCLEAGVKLGVNILELCSSNFCSKLGKRKHICLFPSTRPV